MGVVVGVDVTVSVAIGDAVGVAVGVGVGVVVGFVDGIAVGVRVAVAVSVAVAVNVAVGGTATLNPRVSLLRVRPPPSTARTRQVYKPFGSGLVRMKAVCVSGTVQGLHTTGVPRASVIDSS